MPTGFFSGFRVGTPRRPICIRQPLENQGLVDRSPTLQINRLSDFKPLAEVMLPGAGKIPCAGLTLIVGPNSSGKTQFLNDLYSRVCGDPRRLIVAEKVEVNKPDCEPLIECLEREGYLRRRFNPGNG